MVGFFFEKSFEKRRSTKVMEAGQAPNLNVNKEASQEHITLTL